MSKPQILVQSTSPEAFTLEARAVDGKQAGVISVRRSGYPAENEWSVSYIGVKPEHQRRQIGTALYERAAMHAAKEYGAKRFCSARTRTEAAESFWKKQVAKKRAYDVGNGYCVDMRTQPFLVSFNGMSGGSMRVVLFAAIAIGAFVFSKKAVAAPQPVFDPRQSGGDLLPMGSETKQTVTALVKQVESRTKASGQYADAAKSAASTGPKSPWVRLAKRTVARRGA